MAEKLTRYLLISLILSLGFGQLLRFELGGVHLYLHDLLVVTLLVLQGQALKGVKLPRGLKIFFFGLALGWLNALLHYPLSQLLIPSLYTLRLLAYLALYLTLQHSKTLISNTYFLISGCIVLLIGYAQYIILPDMRVFQYLGWDDHLNRLTLPHFDPTFTGVMLGLFVISSNRKLSSNYFLFPISYLLTISAILLTYSRSIWLSLGITLALSIRPKKLFLFLIPILLVAILLLPKRFGEGNNLLRTYSITSRWQSDWAYVQQYKWDLLLGRGLNTLILDHPTGPYVNHATGPNNSYLYLLLTTGILGLFGWVKFLISLARPSRYPYLILFFALASLFNNVMFYPFVLLWILLFNAIIEN